MRRIMLYDRLGNALGELSEADVFEAVLREEINGEHSLEITTTRVLDKGIRLLYEDGRSKWREFSVAGVDAEHASGNRAIGTYWCVWSMQEDLQGATVSVMPGVQTPATAGTALAALLSNQSRWDRGTVTQTTQGGASMYDRSAWKALSTLIEVWGGEVDAEITVDAIRGVTARAVGLFAAQGEQTANRRFDFGADLQSVKRTMSDDPLYCRISPRGKGEQTDAGGYGRKITIESVNQGKDYLEYAPMVDVAKLPDGQGGYEYPTLIVENSDCETPADLLAWAQGVLASYCTPKVTYEIDVLQAGIEGVDVTGVSLGDAVQVVDRKFGGDGIRIQGRVRSITADLLNERDVSIVIGDAVESVASKFADVDRSLAAVGNRLTSMSTAEYIDSLLERINAEINATGGYTYIVPGNGILTFDVAVADPLNPTEASQVVEVKGGSIRIANSKTAQGAWEWKSVFTSGHIAADLITAANITAGYIGSAGDTFIDLDNSIVQLGQTGTTQFIVNSNGFGFYYGVDGDLMCGFELTSNMVPYYTFGGRVTEGTTVGDRSYVFGSPCTASASYSTAFGYNCSATEQFATVGGFQCTASGNSSFTFGNNNTASAYGSTSFGQSCTASGNYSLAVGDHATASKSSAIALGSYAEASGNYATATGLNTKASGTQSFATGDHTQAGYTSQFVCGKYNSSTSNDLFEVGNGSTSSRSNAFRVTTSNTAYVGSTQVTSDRRVKTPLGDISEEEAAQFVRSLKPSKFEKFGRQELGFYAQDVEETNLGAYLVDKSEDYGFEDFRNLSYDGIIAPLVAYCQHLEKRIEALEEGR